MPRGDGTGPAGAGPMTGRAAGFCAGFGVPGYVNPVNRRGFGAGMGRGRGFGFRARGRMPYYGAGYSMPYEPYDLPMDAAFSPENEMKALQNQAKNLEATLNQINQRITELEQGSKEK